MNETWNIVILQNAIDSALQGNLKKLLSVIDQGISLNLRLEDGITPLEIVSEAGDTDLIKFLIESGANPNIGNPLLVAAFRGWLEIYNLLYPLVSEDQQKEASEELHKGLIRRGKADSDPDYDWDD